MYVHIHTYVTDLTTYDTLRYLLFYLILFYYNFLMLVGSNKLISQPLCEMVGTHRDDEEDMHCLHLLTRFSLFFLLLLFLSAGEPVELIHLWLQKETYDTSMTHQSVGSGGYHDRYTHKCVANQSQLELIPQFLLSDQNKEEPFTLHLGDDRSRGPAEREFKREENRSKSREEQVFKVLFVPLDHTMPETSPKNLP